MNPLRVALDVTPLAGQRTGIGNFVANLAEGLGAAPEVALSGIAMTSRGREEIQQRLPVGTPLGRPVPARLLRQMWLRSDRPTVGQLSPGFGPTKIDVVHGTNYVVPPGGGAAELVSVHDLSAWHDPGSVTETSRAYPQLVDRALARGAHIHAISDFVASELIDDLGVDADRVHMVHLAADPLPEGNPERGRSLAQVGEHGHYILAIGSIEPRKDYPGLVADFAALSGDYPDLRLVIAGGSGFGAAALDAAIVDHAVGDKVTLAGYVDVGAKADLLAGAMLAVSTATYEGFGIVPVEAMAAGVPVLAVAGGSVPEVCGDAACLVPGTGPALQTELRRLLDDPTARVALKERGWRRAPRFSWEATVDGLIEVYQKLAAEAAR